MRKRITLLFILLVGFTFAQEECTFKGQILDKDGLPAIDASITAFDSQNNSAGYTFSDQEGFFELKLSCDTSYELEIEHLEFESFIYQLELTKKTQRDKIVLTRLDGLNLDEVVLNNRIPVQIKGDTIEYDADSFKTGNEETLEDILKKLPGIEVENGKVYHEGKEITTIKVGGREIFGGNTKLLNKNLPSDVVDKIQLQKKMKKNPFANSLQDDEQPELNIILKEDAKNLIFGNTTIGGDANEHWDAQEKLFYFDETKDATLIADYNTFGKEVFTREDYFSFLGGYSELMDEGGKFSLRNSLRDLFFGNSNAAEMNEAVGAFHMGYEPNDKWYVNGFVMADRNELTYRSTNERIYNDGLTIFDDQTNQERVFSTMSRFRVDYQPNLKTQIKYRVNFNFQDTESESEINSLINGIDAGGREVDEDRRNFNIMQKLSYIKKIGEDDNLGIYLTHQWQKENPDWNMQSNQLPFAVFNNATADANGIYNLNQQQELGVNTLQLLGIYNHLLTRTSNLRIKLGGNFSWQNLTNDIFSFENLLDDNNQRLDSDFTFSELYADFTYTKKWGYFEMDLGAGVFQISDQNTGLYGNFDLNETLFLPHLRMEYELNSSSRLNFNYERSYGIPNVRDVSNSYIIQNFSTLYQGSLNLVQSLQDQFNMGYSMFKGTSFMHLYAGVFYNRTVDSFQNESTLQGITQINQPINSPEFQDNYGLNTYFSKRFTKNYSIRFNTNFRQNNYYSFFDGQRLENESFTQNYNLRNIFKFAKKVEFTLGLRYDRSDFSSVGVFNNDNLFSSWTPNGELAWVVNSWLLLTSSYNINLQYQNGEQINDAQNLNAQLRIKPYKGVYVYLTGGNLLDNALIVNNGFNNNFTSVSTTQILGRYLLASVKFKF